MTVSTEIIKKEKNCQEEIPKDPFRRIRYI